MPTQVVGSPVTGIGFTAASASSLPPGFAPGGGLVRGVVAPLGFVAAVATVVPGLPVGFAPGGGIVRGVVSPLDGLTTVTPYVPPASGDGTYELGLPVTVRITVTDEFGHLADPTNILVTVRQPDQTVLTPAVVRDATGYYHATFTPTITGTFTYLWTTGPVPLTVTPGEFTVNDPYAQVDAGWCDAASILAKLLGTKRAGTGVTLEHCAVAGRVATQILSALAGDRIQPLVTVTWVLLPGPVPYGPALGPQGRTAGEAVYGGFSAGLYGGAGGIAGFGLDPYAGTPQAWQGFTRRDSLTLPPLPGTLLSVVAAGKPLTAGVDWAQAPASPVVHGLNGYQWPNGDTGGQVQVTMRHGGIDDAAKTAAEAWACEYALLIAPIPIKPGDSVLGPRVTQVTRQGQTLTMADVTQLAQLQFTGVPVTDVWLATLYANGPRTPVGWGSDVTWVPLPV